MYVVLHLWYSFMLETREHYDFQIINRILLVLLKSKVCLCSVRIKISAGNSGSNKRRVLLFCRLCVMHLKQLSRRRSGM
jgi:hypothetical protein